MGFLVPDDEGPELSFDCFLSDFLAADFTEGSCRREKRSEVALGIFVVEEAGRKAEAIEEEISLDPTSKLGNKKLSDNIQPPPILHPTTRPSWESL